MIEFGHTRKFVDAADHKWLPHPCVTWQRPPCKQNMQETNTPRRSQYKLQHSLSWSQNSNVSCTSPKAACDLGIRTCRAGPARLRQPTSDETARHYTARRDLGKMPQAPRLRQDRRPRSAQQQPKAKGATRSRSHAAAPQGVA